MKAICGTNVQVCRGKMGESMVLRINQVLTAEDIAEIDAVILIPEISNSSAKQATRRLGKPHDDGFVRCPRAATV